MTFAASLPDPERNLTIAFSRGEPVMNKPHGYQRFGVSVFALALAVIIGLTPDPWSNHHYS